MKYLKITVCLQQSMFISFVQFWQHLKHFVNVQKIHPKGLIL